VKIVTTSWDDGDIRDLRVAELLLRYGVRGNFYVPVKPFRGLPSLNVSQMRNMSGAGLEIGAHTVDHEIMSELTPAQTAEVVTSCKRYLEDNLGVEVPMFCYPRGRYKAYTIECLRRAGYQGARTTRMLATSTHFDPFEMPTSSQAFPHSTVRFLRNMARAKNLPGMYDYLAHLHNEGDWVALGKKMFDRVAQDGGIWHLYGHSWELDELNLWAGLEELLSYVEGREGFSYLTNSQTLQQVGLAPQPVLN
jgi:peptidoglycan/xylan/chitin deacetylase (PgdA/CDA1 family)